jgi:para-nitrobenzyl esterase
MMEMWTQFARTGNPSIEGAEQWPVWEKNSDQYLYVNGTAKAKTGFSKLAEPG